MKVTFFHQVPLLIDWQGHSLPAKFVVGVEGPIDPRTGMVLNLAELKKIINEVLPADFNVKIVSPQKFLSEIMTLTRAQFSKRGLKQVAVSEIQLKFFDPSRAIATKGDRAFHQETRLIYDGRKLETQEKFVNTLHGGWVLAESGEQWLWDFSEDLAQKIN